jgi:PAS domain S-box-containing protein
MTTSNCDILTHEKDRLKALFNYNILDTGPEEEFDNITKLLAFICESPIALISLVDQDRQWVKSSFGFNPKSIPRKVSFCQHTIKGNDILEISDTLDSPEFRQNPFVANAPNIRFFAGHPLTTPDGYNIGALCVGDSVPKKLSSDQRLALSTLAKHAMSILELRNNNKNLQHEVENLSKEALEKITLELESYKLALDETSGVLITDEKGNIVFVNDETCRKSKYSREELIGKQSTIFDSGYHPPRFFEELWATILEGNIWKNEIKNLAKDGTFYWTDTTIVPFLDEKRQPKKFVSIKRDITRQKLEEGRIDQFFSLTLDFFCVANTNGYFEKISPSFSNQLGFSDEELLSKPFFEFIHPEDVENTQREIVKLAQGVTTINFKIRFKCKDGSFKLLSWNATPDRESGVLYATARDITDSHRIHDENRKLSLVAKGTNNIVVITDKERNIEWVNRAFEELTGYTQAEVSGKNPGTLLQFENTDPETIYAIRNAMNNQETFVGEIQNISKAGRKYWIELNISPVFNEKGELINFIAIESDVTDKKKKDASITNLIETQNSIFNGVGHAVMFASPSGIIQRINQAGLDLIEYSEAEVVGKMSVIDLHDFGEIVARSMELSKELNRPVVPGFETIIAKTDSSHTMDANEWIYITKSGRKVPVWVSVTCIKNTEGIILGYFSAAEDYTVKKQVEQSLIEAKNLAEQAAQAKDSFLANMSHEIRTPLNAIIGFTELLAQNNLDPTLKDYVNNINTAGSNLLLIINDILDISKIESGQLVIESNPVNLKETLKHVYDLLKVNAQERNLEFNLLLDADMPEFVMGDKGRINQILMNLAGNALKFTEKGEVTISVKKLSETENTIKLRFSVKDTGIGIPENKTNTIFERFTQAEVSTTRRFGGTGLGLSIVKQLVELQNGEINVISKMGQGSDFYFTIDFKKIVTLKKHSQDEKVNKLSEPLKPLSILLCEDNELNQHLAKRVIEKFGFSLDIASNGKEGIDKVMKKDYDLILMDLQMSVMDGHQTTIYIREVLKKDIPIIAMTAHSLVGERQKCIDIGMNEYVSKPFKQTDLLEKIQAVVRLKEESQPSEYPTERLKENEVKSINNLLKTNIVMEAEKNASVQSLQIDFSYIDELSGGDEAFKDEIIKLFIQTMPENLEKLEEALKNRDPASAASLAHHMKSSLYMLKLEREVEFLAEIEKNAKASVIEDMSIDQFENFQMDINAVIRSLETMPIT